MWTFDISFKEYGIFKHLKNVSEMNNDIKILKSLLFDSFCSKNTNNGFIYHNNDENIPAYISYYEGKISSKEYFFDGKAHRINGPARISYDINGQIYNIMYYINGCFYSTSSFARKTNHLICKNCQNFCNQNCF